MAYFIATLIISALLFVAGELLRPKPNVENAKPADLGDFTVPTVTEGRHVPLLWGTCKIEGPNVAWYGDYEQEAITETVGGGIFSSGSEVTTGYKYFLGIQFALCRGPLDALTKIWIGDDLVFDGDKAPNGLITIDEDDLFGGDDLGNGGVEAVLRFKAGGELQGTSSYLEEFQKQGGDTPAYRGTAYLAPNSDPIYVGNSSQIKAWSFEARRLPTGPATGGDEGIGDSDKDANPVNVIFEILTNNDWGMNINPATIDTANFAAVGAVLNTELNGISFLLDRPMEAIAMIKIVEEQIDGILFFNQLTSLWQINLARGDFDIDTVPEMNSTNIVEVKSFSRGSWVDTSNQVRIEFRKRGTKGKYKATYGLAQDLANSRIQNGDNVSVTIRMPACKRKKLANSLAWRELRGLSIPLAKAQIVVDRTFFDVQPATVLAFTDATLGFTKLPMRVAKVNFSELADNRITLDLIQDTFDFAAGSFDEPGDTGWIEPQDVLTPFPADQQLAFEAPRKFLSVNGIFDASARVWCAARKNGPEVEFKIKTSFIAAPSTPTSTFSPAGTGALFMKMGELDSSLSVGTATPLGNFLVTSTPDSQSSIESAITDNPTLDDLGTKMVNLILVDDEFMLVSSAQNSGGDVQFNQVYRGVMDSVQADHLAGVDVFLLAVGGALSTSAFATGLNVDMILLPRSSTDQVIDANATVIEIRPIDGRVRRPYAPSSVSLNSSEFATTVGFETEGSGAETFAYEASLNRRDFRIADGNEINALLDDAETLLPDYPALNNTTHEIEVWDDPDGSPVLLFTETPTGQAQDILRLKVLQATDGALPTRMRLVMRAVHDVGSETGILSRADLQFDFDVTSALTGQFEFTALDTNDVSAVYTADAAGTHAFTLSSSFSAGDVEFRVNGGTWTQLIAAGGTSGNIAGVIVSDTIEIRHLSGDSSALKQIDMAAPGAGTDAFGVLFT